ncbi:tripartite tricarboxylate transporter TctB family protein [Usitatibacter palustris]|uniref:DUF1468 domain-containing protein n=1 Tax=Usitatibacter palustris TaxID=2732487 RepID=A0A6M4HA57_9PROT|nr:tripartite tricarboxylate transporter TctB family protein [Usitatibacter palustris]QJR16132.1 hypothetical protein DSM104440_02961 [Usitatibacter palustris]
MKINKSTDFWGGVMFAAIGLVFAVIAFGVKLGDIVILPGYAMGTAARMGPAYFPFWLGVILFIIGVMIALPGLKGKGKTVEKFHWGPIGFVLGGVCLFGVLLKPMGMPVAALVLVVVASMGSHDFKWKPVIFLALGLIVFSAAVFVYGLKLPIPLCPNLDSLQELRLCRG